MKMIQSKDHGIRTYEINKILSQNFQSNKDIYFSDL